MCSRADRVLRTAHGGTPPLNSAKPNLSYAAAIMHLKDPSRRANAMEGLPATPADTCSIADSTADRYLAVEHRLLLVAEVAKKWCPRCLVFCNVRLLRLLSCLDGRLTSSILAEETAADLAEVLLTDDFIERHVIMLYHGFVGNRRCWMSSDTLFAPITKQGSQSSWYIRIGSNPCLSCGRIDQLRQY